MQAVLAPYMLPVGTDSCSTPIEAPPGGATGVQAPAMSNAAAPSVAAAAAYTGEAPAQPLAPTAQPAGSVARSTVVTVYDVAVTCSAVGASDDAAKPERLASGREPRQPAAADQP